MHHPKLTDERIRRTLAFCYAYPNNRFNASHFYWLARWVNINPTGVWFQPQVSNNIVCTKNQSLEWCLENPAARNFDEFMFIDQDTIYTPETPAFWDSDADVVCCVADMSKDEHNAWGSPLAFHDSLWRVKRHVLEALPPPYFSMQYNAKGTRQVKCVCQSFSDAARSKGFTVEQAGKCGHDHDKTWTTKGCMFA